MKFARVLSLRRRRNFTLAEANISLPRRRHFHLACFACKASGANFVEKSTCSRKCFFHGTGNRDRTCMVSRKILNLVRLPVPPYPRMKLKMENEKLQFSAFRFHLLIIPLSFRFVNRKKRGISRRFLDFSTSLCYDESKQKERRNGNVSFSLSRSSRRRRKDGRV